MKSLSCGVAEMKINQGATLALVPPPGYSQMVSNSSPRLSACKAALGMLCPLWDTRTKEMWANRRECSRVLLRCLGAGAYAVLEESGGTALFKPEDEEGEDGSKRCFPLPKRKACSADGVRLLSDMAPLAVELGNYKRKRLQVAAGGSLMGY